MDTTLNLCALEYYCYIYFLFNTEVASKLVFVQGIKLPAVRLRINRGVAVGYDKKQCLAKPGYCPLLIDMTTPSISCAFSL